MVWDYMYKNPAKTYVPYFIFYKYYAPPEVIIMRVLF